MNRAKSPLVADPVSNERVPFLHECYSHTARDGSDSTMVWGSQVDMTNLQLFVKQRNSNGNVLVTPTTILARAVGIAQQKHPAANRRLVGTRIYQFSEQNVLLPLQTRSAPQLVLLQKIDQQSYGDLATELLKKVTEEITQSNRPTFRELLTCRLPHSLRGLGVRLLF